MAGSSNGSSRRAQTASRLLVLLLVGLFLLGAAGFVVSVITVGERRAAPGPPAAAPPTSGAPTSAPASPAAEPAPSPTVAPTMAAAGEILLAMAEVGSGTPPAEVSSDPAMPIVPVAGFWGTASDIALNEVIDALRTGETGRFRRVVVPDAIREALAESLGIPIHERVAGGDVASVERAVARGALGFLAASDVTPRVRALAVDDRSLFGNDRVESVTGWPLLVSMAAVDRGDATADAPGPWSQEGTWVLVAAGDSMTDRDVYERIVVRSRGIDFPFDGGTARVTGHGCCDPRFHTNVVPRVELTGGSGFVRRMVRDAELAVANHEAPVTPKAVWHRTGTTFSARPELTKVFTRAGIDWFSLANNHIKDAGTAGIADSRRILREHGLAFGGAGRDLEQARQISYLDVGEIRVAMVPCVGVASASWAGEGVSGGTPCKDRTLVPDIKAASREADVVIAFPHWGVEYSRTPTREQRRHAARWVKAGADLVLGSHSHVFGAIEEIDGVPVLYSMGNFIFDQPWSEPTLESLLTEATFQGDRLVQLRLHPYVIVDRAQPNFLDPVEGAGRDLLLEVRKASTGFLDW
jgi:poly-gamma-glutamate capsule biosynthesis protein CapA/YwtB (metallophosphatase superfamily)